MAALGGDRMAGLAGWGGWSRRRFGFGEVFLNLRNRLIWIAALSVAFAGVQLLASRRKAEREHNEYVKSKLIPLANECARQTQERLPELHGVLSVQVRVVPDGKLDAVVEQVELSSTSALQERELVACMRERAMTLVLKLPLPGGPEQLDLTFPIEPASEQRKEDH